MTRQTFGDYREFCKPLDPKEVPQLFKQVYLPLIASIMRRGGKPLPESIRIYILDSYPELPGRFGVKIDADFAKKSALEELNDKILFEDADNQTKEGNRERKTVGKSGGKKNRGNERNAGI